MESPSSPTVQSSATTSVVNLNHHHYLAKENSSSSTLFSMTYPFKVAQSNYPSAPPAALISPDSHSTHHRVLTVGGSPTSPVLVTKRIVTHPSEGDVSSSPAAGVPSKSLYIHPAPIVPKPTAPVLEYSGIPLPQMPIFPSYQRSTNSSGGVAGMDGGVISRSNSVTSDGINLVPGTTLEDHHHDRRPSPPSPVDGGPVRLNKFVRRLRDMLIAEKDSGVVEWRRGLLVLYSTDAFSKRILPKYFNTRNFKTFRRQLNYYGFVHVRSFSATGNTTTALWINQELARDDANNDISAVLKLRRVEPCETAKTVEGRRQRKELALHTVEEDIGLNSKKLQLDQIRFMAIRGEEYCSGIDSHPQQTMLLPQTTVQSGSSSDYCQQPSMSHLMVPPPSTATNVVVGIPREVHIPTDSEESNHQSDSCCEEEFCPSPIPSPPTTTTAPVEQDDAMLLQNVNTAAANMLLMLARS